VASDHAGRCDEKAAELLWLLCDVLQQGKRMRL
jgi:hypothetical protein